MITLIAKIMMAISFLFYGGLITAFWISAILGWHNDIWELYDFPVQPAPPPLWIMGLGLFFTILAFSGLLMAYVAVWKILNGGTDQDFCVLASRMRKLAIGLFGFWLGYNLIYGAISYLLVIITDGLSNMEVDWDPFGTDVIYLIMSIAIFAIAKTLHRAWEAEEEMRHFL